MSKTELTGKQIKDQSVDLSVDTTGILPVANGGTGSDTLPLNSVIVGNGNGALQSIAPGTSGNILVSDGNAWVSAAPTVGSGDVASTVSSSVDSEVVLFSGTTGKSVKQATGTGWAYLTSGVLSTDTPDASTVGLGNVDNTSDLAKPISTATQSALDTKSNIGHEHVVADVTGLSTSLSEKEPAVTAGTSAQYYRGDKTWATLNAAAVSGAEATANKNVANGYCGLDENGFVPSARMPSYVDDVIEASDFASLPGTGESGKIYIALAEGKIYRWSGSAYVEISPSPGSTDSVVEGSTNLYFTNARADARIANAVGTSVQAYNANLTTWAAETAPTGTVVGDTDTQTLSAKTLSNPTIEGYTEGSVTATVTTAYTFNIASDSIFNLTFTSGNNCTFTMPTAAIGKSFTVMLKQPASGTTTNTGTFTGVKWGTTGTPTISTGANKMDILSFFSDGSFWYGSAAQGYTAA